MEINSVLCKFYVTLTHQNRHLGRPLRVKVSLNRIGQQKTFCERFFLLIYNSAISLKKQFKCPLALSLSLEYLESCPKK